MSRLIESPIEQQMLDAMHAVSWRKIIVVEEIGLNRLKHMATADEAEKRVFLVPQMVVGQYRADFMLACYRTGIYPTVACVECDGHDYHKATDEQISRDRERDHWMRSKLIEPLRFSGKQIARDSYGCAQKAIAFVTQETGPQRGFEMIGKALIRALDRNPAGEEAA